MRKDERFYKNLLDSLHDGVYFVDRDRRITYWNKGAERISGYENSEVVGMCCSDNLLMHINEEGANLCEKGCPLSRTLSDGLVREAEVYLRHKDGHRVPIFVRVSPLRDSGGDVVGAVETFSDSSSKAELIHRLKDLQRMALLDPLTERANRRCINIKLRSRLDEMKRYGWPFGVLFIDIDNFKAVNDEYGHSIGDKVLRMVARTLSSSLRSFDILGRYGGEEFVAIITNVDAEQLYSFANRLRILVEKSTLSTESGTVRVTVSIGATLAQPDDSVETLIKRADQLMYDSKSAGRNLVSVKLLAGQSDGDRLRAAWSAKREGCDNLVAGEMGE
jgi:diguanylate cyclase (GGDEF)-like protein/PAS domain S-box-containing protein